jgi:thiol-disulfide isomerase/thioredoxin
MVGDRAPAIQVAEWVQGTPVARFEPGVVTVVEFWATWCGPCKVAIPHLNELAQRYAGKARFVGVSVWERISAEKPYAVPDFVRRMGDKMTYTVAADVVKPGDDSGPMARTWMEAAGQGSIPTAFIVDGQGRIAWIGHPMGIDQPLADVVAGTFDVAAAARKYALEVKAKSVASRLGREITKAKKAKDFAGALALLEKAMAENSALETSFGLERYFLLLETQRAAEAATYGRRLVADVFAENASALNALAWNIVDPQGKWKQGDHELAVLAAQRAVDLVKGEDASTLDTLGLALFRGGHVARAIEVQEKAVALARGQAELEGDLSARLAEFRRAAKAP